ncbi:hypothetical protein [Sutcliffiella sp. NC1]|nr:hypothetical protein [Sutcliffiella sp. NC1]WBL13747.1 hypothetical protein O1A01_17760 [Sutcliffiella sp. NC1]
MSKKEKTREWHNWIDIITFSIEILATPLRLLLRGIWKVLKHWN